MGVTADQVALVQKSFEPFGNNAEESGKAFFLRLFELHPESKVYFKHLEVADLGVFGNPDFQAHYGKVITTLGTMIDNLKENDSAANNRVVNRLVAIHKNRNIKPEQTQFIKNTMLSLLSTEEGSELYTAWSDVLDALLGAYNVKLTEAWATK